MTSMSPSKLMLMINEINLKAKGLCLFIRPSFKPKAKSQPISPMGQFLKPLLFMVDAPKNIETPKLFTEI